MPHSNLPKTKRNNTCSVLKQKIAMLSTSTEAHLLSGEILFKLNYTDK
jgi:hypothetical protein